MNNVLRQSNRNGKVPISVKLGFGMGSISYLMFTLLYTYGMYFFTDVVGIAPAFAGTIFAIGTLWDAITDPLIGSWSDNIKTKWGRRRPVVLGVTIPYVLFSWLLLTDFGFGQLMTNIYFVVIIILYYTASTLFDVPYSALGAELNLLMY